MELKEIILGLLSAVVGGISGFLAAWWQTKRAAISQELSNRIEDLCTSIGKLEEISCLYWQAYQDEQGRTPSEPYIVGLQTKIGILLDYLAKEYPSFKKEFIAKSLAEFDSACTGGDFGVANRKTNSNRQREILITGEKLKIGLLKTRNSLH